tara:strand:- start:135 stop:305 length:171 start_codon:yes stop_codon:yes gene_type:complete
MENYVYKFFKGADVNKLLNKLFKSDNATMLLISAVGYFSKLSIKCPLNNKPIILEK